MMPKERQDAALEAAAREKAMVERIRAEVVAQADAQGENGWLEIDVSTKIRENGRLRVPRAPFELWAVARAGAGHLVTPWKIVSPIGLKQDGDDRFHSDWLIGAGFGIHDMMSFISYEHSRLLRDAAEDASFDIQQRVLNFECAVLMPGEFRSCKVCVPQNPGDLPSEQDFQDHGPAVLLPDAGPDWVDVAYAALQMQGAVIVERGGSMAHLITVMREDSRGPIVRVPDARRKFAPGTLLYVNPDTGQVTLHDELYSRFRNVADPFSP
jgi:hypothetical protein